MSAEDILSRVFNPAIILTMVAAGIAYGGFLWALDIRPMLRLYAAAVFPGVIFIATILAVRGLQGTLSLLYLLLIVNYLIFANVGVITVAGWRRWHRRRVR